MNPYHYSHAPQWPFFALVAVCVLALALLAQLHAPTRRYSVPALGAITPLVVIILVIALRFWRAQPLDIWAAPLYYSLRGFAPVLLVSALLGGCAGLLPRPLAPPWRFALGLAIGIAVIVVGALLKPFG